MIEYKNTRARYLAASSDGERIGKDIRIPDWQ